MSSSSLSNPVYLLVLLGVSAPAIYLSATTSRLLKTYPTTDIDPSHPVYSVRSDTRFKQTDCHWFSARVPAKLLRPPNRDKSKHDSHKNLSPVEVWTSTFFSTPTLALEASLIGLATGNGLRTGDQGTSGIKPGQALAHGAFMVESIDKSENRAIVSYNIPNNMVALWERAASWGWPYRHLSRGRHCLEIEYDTGKTAKITHQTLSDDEEEFVTVKFGCAIDIEKVNRATGEEDGKTMPVSYIWFHEMYARWLIDGAVEKLKRTYAASTN